VDAAQPDAQKEALTAAIKKLGVDHPEIDAKQMLRDFEEFYAECPHVEAAYSYILHNAESYMRKAGPVPAQVGLTLADMFFPRPRK
jgi:hypothetical protein